MKTYAMGTTPLRAIALFLLFGAGGWSAVWLNRGAGREGNPAGANAAAGAVKGKTPRPLPRTPEEFQAWVDATAPGMVRQGYDFLPDMSDIGQWSVAELHAALEDGLHDPANARGGPATQALGALLEEWTRRDPDAAWTWLHGIPAEPMRTRLIGALDKAWPAERAEEGLAMAIANRDDFENQYTYGYATMVKNACESASSRGPEAVAGILRQLQEHGMQYPFEAVKFAAGFDFATLARSPEVTKMGGGKGLMPVFLMDGWMQQSPEGAVDGMLALNRESGADLGQGLAAGLKRINLLEPELMSDRARRVAGKTSELDPEERRQVNEAVGQQLVERPELLKEFYSGYKDPALRAEACGSLAAPLLARHMPDALDLVEMSAGPVEQRMGMLDDLLSARKEKAYLATEDQEKVRTKLTAWGLSVEETDAAIKRMEPPRPF